MRRLHASGEVVSFTVEDTEMFKGNWTFRVEGTFDIPCCGRALEGKCTAGKVILD